MCGEWMLKTSYRYDSYDLTQLLNFLLQLYTA